MSREGNRPEALDERQRSNTSVSAGLLIPSDTRQRDYKRVIRKKKEKKKRKKKKESVETIYSRFILSGDARREVSRRCVQMMIGRSRNPISQICQISRGFVTQVEHRPRFRSIVRAYIVQFQFFVYLWIFKTFAGSSLQIQYPIRVAILCRFLSRFLRQFEASFSTKSSLKILIKHARCDNFVRWCAKISKRIVEWDILFLKQNRVWRNMFLKMRLQVPHLFLVSHVEQSSVDYYFQN